MNLADFAATTRSQASATFAPAPAATPLTRAITGWGSEVRVRIRGFQLCLDRLAQVDRFAGATARSLRSCPAQKPRPAPVSTSTRASPRFASASRSSSCICAVKLLRRSGRLRVIRATVGGCFVWHSKPLSLCGRGVGGFLEGASA